jgi:hypothetical protein
MIAPLESVILPLRFAFPDCAFSAIVKQHRIKATERSKFRGLIDMKCVTLSEESDSTIRPNYSTAVVAIAEYTYG